MCLGYALQPGSINYQLPTFFDNPTQLVTRLSPNPHFSVVLVKQGHYSCILASRILDVNLTAYCSGAPECGANVTCEQRKRPKRIVFFTSHDRIEGNYRCRHKIRRSFDQLARRSLNPADDFFDTCKRAQPMGLMCKVG